MIACFYPQGVHIALFVRGNKLNLETFTLKTQPLISDHFRKIKTNR